MEKLRSNKRIILYLVFVLLVLGLIFYFSSNNAIISSEKSGKVAAFVMRVFGIEDTLENTNLVHIIVRKMAHYSLFTLLGIGLRGLFGSFNVKYKNLAAILCGLAVSAGDEIHQLFVPGRAGMFTDVLIDMCGVLSGVFFLCCLGWIIKRIRTKKNLGA